MIRFYFHPTPNPAKVALFLEEAGLPYELVPVDTAKGEQHAPAYRAINPNGKVPAIVDTEGPSGAEVRVFDSSAILLYLGDKTQRFIGSPGDRPELLSWLFFIATGLGPFSGQAVHFQHAAPEKIPYATNRYSREAERHYRVLDRRLAGRDYIVGTDYTIVDMSAWGWLDRAGRVLPGETPPSAPSRIWSAGSRPSTRGRRSRAPEPSARGTRSRGRWTKRPVERCFHPTIPSWRNDRRFAIERTAPCFRLIGGAD